MSNTRSSCESSCLTWDLFVSGDCRATAAHHALPSLARATRHPRARATATGDGASAVRCGSHDRERARTGNRRGRAHGGLEGRLHRRGHGIRAWTASTLRVTATSSRRSQANGCLVTEFPLRHAPFPGTFPAPQSIISGLSRAVLVVEANVKERVLVTARCAARRRPRSARHAGIDPFASRKGVPQVIQEGAALAAKRRRHPRGAGHPRRATRPGTDRSMAMIRCCARWARPVSRPDRGAMRTRRRRVAAAPARMQIAGPDRGSRSRQFQRVERAS
jgi:hypothetical protein